MSLTYRQISCREKIQGGGSFNNLFVNRKVSLSQALMIPTEPDSKNFISLVESVRKSLMQNALMIRRMAIAVRIFLQSYYIREYSTFPDILISEIEALSLLPTTEPLVASIVAKVNSLFVTIASPLLINDTAFINTLVTQVGAVGLFSINITTSIMNYILDTLPYDQRFLSKISNIVNTRLQNSQDFRNMVAKIKDDFAYSVDIPPSIFYNKISLNLIELNIENNFLYTIYLKDCNFVCSVADSLQRIVCKAVYKNNFEVYTTFYDVTYASPLTTIQVNFTKFIKNTTGNNFSLYLSFYCETLDGYVTATVNSIIRYSKIELITLPDYFFSSLTLYNSATVQVYDSTSTLVQTFSFPDKGIVQFSRDKKIWSFTLPSTLKLVSCTYGYNTLIAGNIVGIINTPNIDNFYNGGVPIMVVSLNSNGLPEWVANISCLGVSAENVMGITTDVTGNIYIYGTHTTGSQLYVYNSDRSLYPNFVDSTPFVNVSTGLLYKNNAFIIKLNPDGFALGFATLKGYNDQSINYAYLDLYTNTVYVTGSSNTSDTTLLTGFNNESIILPQKARNFVLGLNNVAQSKTTQCFIVEANTVSETVSPEKICTDQTGNIFILYFVNSSAVKLYNSNDFETVTTITTPCNLILVQYDRLGLVSWYITLRTTFTDRNCQMCVDSDSNLFLIFRRTSDVTLTSGGTITNVYPVINIPANTIDGNIVAKFLLDNSLVNISTISNSVIEKAIIIKNFLYVYFTFTNICTINLYTYYSGSWIIENINIILGEEGKKGNAVVKFSTASLRFSLVAFAYNS
jgi:hypothetical protein